MGRKKYSVTGPRIRRRSRKRFKRRPSINKYAHLVASRNVGYKAEDKTFRELPILGTPGETVRAGLRLTFHGRIYSLEEDVTISPVSAVPGVPDGKSATLGHCKLVTQIC